VDVGAWDGREGRPEKNTHACTHTHTHTQNTLYGKTAVRVVVTMVGSSAADAIPVDVGNIRDCKITAMDCDILDLIRHSLSCCE
jgi:hypothetical protein